jgi:hypothetical protein
MEGSRDGLKMIEVAERYGVSRQTVHRLRPISLAGWTCSLTAPSPQYRHQSEN